MTVRQFFTTSLRRFHRLWYAPVLCLAMSLMLLRLLVMARLLDVSAFAQYSAGLLVSSSFCMLGCLGLQSLLQRELPVMIVRRREYAGGVLLVQCALIAIFCAIAVISIATVGDISLASLSPQLLALALIHGLAQQLFLVATVDSRSRSQSLKFARQNLDRSLIVFIVAGATAAAGCQVAVVLSVEAIVSMLLSALLVRHQLRAIPLRLTFAVRLAMNRLPFIEWRAAFALLAVASISFLVINADRWYAAQRLQPMAFAQYAFAWTVLMVAQSVQVIFNASLYPLLARHFASFGGSSAYIISLRASLGILLCASVLAMPLWAILDYVIAYSFASYNQARELLPLFLITAILRISDFWSSYLIIISRETLLLALNLFSAATATATWWLFIMPNVDAPSPAQIAILALLLASSNYTASAVAAWICARNLRREAL